MPGLDLSNAIFCCCFIPGWLATPVPTLQFEDGGFAVSIGTLAGGAAEQLVLQLETPLSSSLQTRHLDCFLLHMAGCCSKTIPRPVNLL
jgi:hypothetical protein